MFLTWKAKAVATVTNHYIGWTYPGPTDFLSATTQSRYLDVLIAVQVAVALVICVIANVIMSRVSITNGLGNDNHQIE